MKITIDREVKPSELVSLVFGTGALTMPWWRSARWMRWVDGGDTSVILDPTAEDVEAQEGDFFRLVVDDPDEPEGSGKTRIVLVTMTQMCDAAGKAIAEGNVYDGDAISDNLGYCDAIEADCVMQWAAFSEVVYG